MKYAEYIGRTQTREDVVCPTLVARLAATLEVPVRADGALPALWHWILFQDWVPASGLGADGHPKRGGFLTAVQEFPRRMWGGGRVSFQRPLSVGEQVTRTSTIQRIQEKVGASGRMVFVTVGHAISDTHGLAITEEQDIIYREAAGAAVKPGERAQPAPGDAFSREVRPDPVLLFRYSALTGNGHRIHYDVDYARRKEGYPGLVVHGPLQAIWLADLASRQCPDARIERFDYRGQRAAIAGSSLTLEGWRDGTLLRLRTCDSAGVVCMTAEARF
jgi:hydroxyacyl-ACP dehydratase HTD2-like protein with hotdog domain